MLNALRPVPLLLLAASLWAQSPTRPRPGADLYPAYAPVTREAFSPAQLLVKEARWLRNQVWASGPVSDASSFLFPRSYDVTSGYGFLGTGYYTWMLANNDRYFQYDASHNTHLGDVPKDASNDAVIERVMTAWGANAYDCATWAVALSAATLCRAFTREDKADFLGAVNAYLNFLVTASYPGGLRSYRAYDPDGVLRWSYGESGEDAARGVDPQGRPLDARNAFLFQFSPPRWQNPDPHWDPEAKPGTVMNWPGWSVITGEQAWAAFLGPMQLAYNQGAGRPGWASAAAPLDALRLVDNACRALRAVTLMRNSVTGGLYRNVRPPDSPDGPEWFATSLENNWSMYTGLGFLDRALTDLKAHPPKSQVLEFDLDQAQADLRDLRKGMRGFFLNRALVWHAKGEPFGDPAAVEHAFFLQGTVGRAGAATGVTSAFATDVQTWGIAAILGDRELERTMAQQYGPHFLYDMFRAAIDLGGYYAPGAGRPTLAGIGFNAQRPGAADAQMSGEWTWGAINAAILLADFYREPAQADPARAEELLGYARAMIAGVNRYTSHYYNPQHLANGLDWVGYLYANRRQWIPWGWFSNVCPSMAATSWALRVNCGFNAFELGGGDHQATVKALGLAGR